MVQVRPFKETRTYKWPVAAFNAVRENPIDAGIAITFAAVFVAWAVGEAWHAEFPLTAFADSWGDFGGSIIGGLVAFLLARLTFVREERERLKERVFRAAPAASTINNQFLKWTEEELTLIERIEDSLRMHQFRGEISSGEVRVILRSLCSANNLSAPKSIADADVGTVAAIWPDYVLAMELLGSRLQQIEYMSESVVDQICGVLNLDRANVDIDEAIELSLHSVSDESIKLIANELKDLRVRVAHCLRLVDLIMYALSEITKGRLPELEDKDSRNVLSYRFSDEF